MTTQHSIFAPSASDRWIPCPASISMTKNLPSETSIYAMQGSACHWVAEQAQKKNLSPITFIGQMIDVGEKEKVQFTSAMSEIVQVYLAELELIKKEYPKCKSYTEKSLPLKPQPERGQKIFGTIDYHIKQLYGDLVIVDLKAGAGVMVDADNNQMKLYACIVIAGDWDEYSMVRMIVIQPQDHDGNIRKEHTMTTSELKTWYEDKCKPAIKNALSDKPKFGPSEKACRWCGILEVCKAAANKVIKAAASEFDDGFDPALIYDVENSFKDPDKFSNDEIGDILPIIDLYRVWSNAVTAYAINELTRGRKIKGYKLVKGKSNRIWTDENKVQKILKGLKIKAGDMFTKKFKSPSKILKLVPKGKQDKLKPYIDKPAGKPTLAKESSKKPEYIPAQTEFDDGLFN